MKLSRSRSPGQAGMMVVMGWRWGVVPEVASPK